MGQTNNNQENIIYCKSLVDESSYTMSLPPRKTRTSTVIKKSKTDITFQVRQKRYNTRVHNLIDQNTLKQNLVLFFWIMEYVIKKYVGSFIVRNCENEGYES